MNQNILITGGTGFLGSGLVKSLIKDGNKVKIFDNNSRGALEKLSGFEDNFEFIEGDIRDFEAVNKSMKKIDIVYHLAYVNGTKYFYEKPELVLDVGVKGSLNTIDAAIKNNVSKYIVASSSEVYQEPTSIPTKENERIIIPDVQNPRFSYSGGKIITELLTLHCLKNKCERIIFRPHNIYGPNMGWEHVVPDFMKKIRQLSKDGKIKNINFPIQGSGEETRAFCFIDDAVDGIKICSSKGKDGNIYHLGLNEIVNIKTLALKIGKITKTNLQISNQTLREGSTSQRCPDITKLKDLGYHPKVNLEEGLKLCWNWYKNAKLPL